MAMLNPYLNFAGNTEEAFSFYRSVFGNDFTWFQRFRDTPEAGKIPAHEQDKIMHVALPIGGANTLMATDALESMGQKLTFGNNIHLAIQAKDREEAERIFRALSAEGGEVTMALQDAFWGAYFGMLRDKFGINWMVSSNNDQPHSSPNS